MASFSSPIGVALGLNGTLYIGDYYNNRIRMVSTDGMVSTVAGSGWLGMSDGAGTNAMFNGPGGIAVDSAGVIYVADYQNQRIRKISTGGVVSTFAGSSSAGWNDGTGSIARFYYPQGVALDALGNVYVADSYNNNPSTSGLNCNIRKISSGGLVTTIAGSGYVGFADGLGRLASFNRPFGLAVDLQGTIYVADTLNNIIRKISSAGMVSTLCGSRNASWADGTGASSSFWWPTGVAVDASGALFVGDANNNRIRKIT